MVEELEESGMETMVIVGLVLLLMALVAISALTYKKPTREEYKVTTKAGEIYKFTTVHHCGKHLKKAVLQIYSVQDKPLTKVGLKSLPTVAQDLARVYDGKVKLDRHCGISKFKVKTIKQVKPKKEVKK